MSAVSPIAMFLSKAHAADLSGCSGPFNNEEGGGRRIAAGRGLPAAFQAGSQGRNLRHHRSVGAHP